MLFPKLRLQGVVVTLPSDNGKESLEIQEYIVIYSYDVLSGYGQ
ncbi:hypothetical protein IGK51_003833 [Enterococcus sp. DIV0098]